MVLKQLFAGDQTKQKWTTIGHRTAFNNEQSAYRIVSYKTHRNDKCKTIHTRKLPAQFMHKTVNKKKIYNNHWITRSWLRTGTYRIWRDLTFSGHPTHHLTVHLMSYGKHFQKYYQIRNRTCVSVFLAIFASVELLYFPTFDNYSYQLHFRISYT